MNYKAVRKSKIALNEGLPLKLTFMKHKFHVYLKMIKQEEKQ